MNKDMLIHVRTGLATGVPYNELFREDFAAIKSKWRRYIHYIELHADGGVGGIQFSLNQEHQYPPATLFHIGMDRRSHAVWSKPKDAKMEHYVDMEDRPLTWCVTPDDIRVTIIEMATIDGKSHVRRYKGPGRALVRALDICLDIEP